MHSIHSLPPWHPSYTAPLESLASPTHIRTCVLSMPALLDSVVSRSASTASASASRAAQAWPRDTASTASASASARRASASTRLASALASLEHTSRRMSSDASNRPTRSSSSSAVAAEPAGADLSCGSCCCLTYDHQHFFNLHAGHLCSIVTLASTAYLPAPLPQDPPERALPPSQPLVRCAPPASAPPAPPHASPSDGWPRTGVAPLTQQPAPWGSGGKGGSSYGCVGGRKTGEQP